MRMLTTLTVFTFAAMTLGAVATQAQTTQPACGVETWSTDKMAYVSTPCPGGQPQQTGQAQGQQPAAQNNSGCGVETWSTDKMMYVTTPCQHTTTYENPGSAQQ